MHPQELLLVYVNNNSSKGNILPLFFLHLGHNSTKTCVCVCTFMQSCTFKIIIVQFLCSSQKEHFVTFKLLPKISKGTYYQKYDNQLLIQISENTVIYFFKYITTVEQKTKKLLIFYPYNHQMGSGKQNTSCLQKQRWEGFQKNVLQLSHKLDDSKDKKGNHCEQSACGHMTAKYNSFLQLKHLPMNEKSEKYSEKQATLLI